MRFYLLNFQAKLGKSIGISQSVRYQIQSYALIKFLHAMIEIITLLIEICLPHPPAYLMVEALLIINLFTI